MQRPPLRSLPRPRKCACLQRSDWVHQQQDFDRAIKDWGAAPLQGPEAEWACPLWLCLVLHHVLVIMNCRELALAVGRQGWGTQSWEDLRGLCNPDQQYCWPIWLIDQLTGQSNDGEMSRNEGDCSLGI